MHYYLFILSINLQNSKNNFIIYNFKQEGGFIYNQLFYLEKYQLNLLKFHLLFLYSCFLYIIYYFYFQTQRMKIFNL